MKGREGFFMTGNEQSNLKRLLIVDDDEGTVFGYTRYFRRAGFSVESADDLASGIKRLADEGFDAVIFDVCLPDGNAIDVIPDLRARNKTIKIFVVSGLTDPAVEKAALEAGADKFLVKPLSVEDLCAQIAGAFAPAP
jgi:two-component system, NtrC family, response regulator